MELKGIHVTESEPQLFTQNVLRHDIPAQHYVGSASIDRGRTQKHPFTVQYARVPTTPTTISYHFYPTLASDRNCPGFVYTSETGMRITLAVFRATLQLQVTVAS